MFYVIERNGKLIKLEIPDDARAITEEDNIKLAEQEQAAQARLDEYNAKLAKEETKISIISEISALKRKLQATDYRAIKFAEGELSVEEFTPDKIQRREWRAEINNLEARLNELK